MPVTIKKRYARSTRFRKIMSPNLSLQQTRRDPITLVLVGLTAETASCSVNKPVIIPSNAAEITGIKGNGGSFIEVDHFEQTSAQSFNIIFKGAVAITEVDVPFEDPAVRSTIGGYMNPGIYQFIP